MSAIDVGESSAEALPLRGSALQRRLAEAAVELFYRQGAPVTTVREITQACGLTPGALYNHFSSKEELLYTVVRDIHLRLESLVAEAQAAAAGGPAAQLVAIVEVYVARHSVHRRRARVANREYTLLSGERRAEVVAIRRRLRNRLADVLAAGACDGVFHLAGGAEGDAAVLTAIAIIDMCVHISEWFHERPPHGHSDLQARYARLALRMAGAAAPYP